LLVQITAQRQNRYQLTPQVDRKLFGYKNHIGIDRAHGLIRTWDASAANAHDGARLPDLISKENTASGVWADTAYRSKKNEAFLARGMFTSNIHHWSIISSASHGSKAELRPFDTENDPPRSRPPRRPRQNNPGRRPIRPTCARAISSQMGSSDG
jgi:hypothetical protein